MAKVAESAHYTHTRPKRWAELCSPKERADRGRAAFAVVMFRSAPEALDSLKQIIKPAYERTINALWEAGRDGEVADIISRRLRNRVTGHPRAIYADLREAIQEWATRHHLLLDGDVPDWVQTFACDMLLRERAATSARYIPSIGGRIMLPPEESCSVSFGWDPSSETRAEAERRIMATIRESLDQIEAEARRGGLSERFEIRQPEHFNWAVRFQVRGESVKAISDSFHGTPDERTIRYGIEHALKLVGLTRRPEKPGPKPPNSGN